MFMKKKISSKKLLVGLCFLLIFFINIGYSACMSSLNVVGIVSATKYDDIFVSEFYISDNNETSLVELESYSGLSTSTKVNFTDSEYAYVTYTVTVSNGTDYIQKFNGEVFNSSDDVKNVISYELSEGIEKGNFLMPGESTTFKLTYKYVNSSNSGDYDLLMNFDFTSCGDVSYELFTKEVDLTGIDRAAVKLVVANNGDSAVNYSLSSDNDKFLLTDKDGNALSDFTIGANSKEDVIVYISKKSSVIYYVTNYKTNISLSYDTVSYSFDTVNITTNISEGYEDTTPPLIGPVSLNISNTNGTFTANWSNLDSGNCAPVTSYTVLLYKSDGSLVKSVTTSGDSTSYTFTGMAEGDYYAIVYGVDEALNSGEGYVSSATVDTTNCRKSATTNMRWLFNITYNLSSVSKSGPDTAYRGEKVTITLNASSNKRFDSTPTITDSNGNALDSSEYSINTSSTSSGTITINSMSKDIIINASASTTCLIEGTRVLLSNGEYKNIEDIGYDDLLVVYNHETGEFTYEYPIWIESGNVTDSYLVINFSDGTSLRTVGSHTVFSVDKNRYVDVTNRDDFDVGSRVLKVDNDKDDYSFMVVSVTSIETKYERAQYYDVVSTRYYNIIADDVLTNDGRVGLVNFYEFKENALWSDRCKEDIVYSDYIDYDRDMSFVPYYLYHGLRAWDGAFIVKYNYMSKEEFLGVFSNLLLNSDMMRYPITDFDGDRVWMVTTSDDVVINKSDYLYKEGSKYVLKEPLVKDGFAYWYNASDGKRYRALDTVVVYHGMHFVAVYK